MKIGIDISQLAYEKTGVANYLRNLVQKLIETDSGDEFILFYSSLRKKLKISDFRFKKSQNIKIKEFRIPPILLDFLWNRLHILSIENLIGDVDIFITSDWTEPPAKHAKKATILYDLIVYKYPKETDKKIVEVQKRKLKWVKKESSVVFCISKSTADDAKDILGIEDYRLSVVYPGM
jgi:hypothetical protein